MVSGERFLPGETNVRIGNTSNIAYDVKLKTSVIDENGNPADGVTFHFEKDVVDNDLVVEILPNEAYVIVVAFTLDENMLPGKYTMTIGADIVPDQTRGIVAVFGVTQEATLEVFGEAGSVAFNLLDVLGDAFFGRITVYRDNGTSLNEVSNIDFNDRYLDRLVPGDYVVVVNYPFNNQQEEVLRERFTLKNNDNLSFTYTVKTVFIDAYTFSSTNNADGMLLNATINYRLRNVYEIYTNVVVKLAVSLNGTPLETLDIQNISSFDVGILDLRYSYAPANGWQDGTYSFVLSVVIAEAQPIVLAITDAYDIFIDLDSDEGGLPFIVFIIAGIILLLFLLLLLLLLLGKKRSPKEEKQPVLVAVKEEKKPVVVAKEEPEEEEEEDESDLENIQIFKNVIEERKGFYESLTSDEQSEFKRYFVDKHEEHFAPELQYEIGKNNGDFFMRVFNYIYRYRRMISYGLLVKLSDELQSFSNGDPQTQTLLYEAAIRVAYFRRKSVQFLDISQVWSENDVKIHQTKLNSKNTYVYSFTRLAIILEKKKAFKEALELVEDALKRQLNDKTRTGYQGRKVRLTDKLGAGSK
jgi:hypothetical protein